MYAKIEEYKEKFADYGRDRRSAIEFHLRNIERLLMPTQTTSVVLASLQFNEEPTPAKLPQQPSTVPSTAVPAAIVSSAQVTPQTSDATTPELTSSTVPVAPSSSSTPLKVPPNLTAKSLFRHLSTILEVTPEQAAALKDSRFVAQEMDECLKASLVVLKELRERLAQCGEDLEAEFTNVRAILTPTQAAKFLVWVANNKACMHMLNELWNKVYPPEDGVDDSGDNSP